MNHGCRNTASGVFHRAQTELAQLVASHAPLTLQVTKEALRRLGEGHGEAGADEDLIVQCYTSQDFREGMDAFLNKRAPVWRGV